MTEVLCFKLVNSLKDLIYKQDLYPTQVATATINTVTVQCQGMITKNLMLFLNTVLDSGGKKFILANAEEMS